MVLPNPDRHVYNKFSPLIDDVSGRAIPKVAKKKSFAQTRSREAQIMNNHTIAALDSTEAIEA
jgi:hypothetical protein